MRHVGVGYIAAVAGAMLATQSNAAYTTEAKPSNTATGQDFYMCANRDIPVLEHLPQTKAATSTYTTTAYCIPFTASGELASSHSVKSSQFNEAIMGITFPPSLSFESSAWSYPSAVSFMGAAPRCMQNMCWLPLARAYSLGLYINRNTLESKFSMEELQKNPLLVFDPSVDKFFRIVFKSSKHGDHILKGFKSALKQCYPEASDSASNQSVHDIAKFTELLTQISFEKGSVLLLCLISEPPPGKIVILHGKDENAPLTYIGEVEGEGLRLAFHNLYLKKADGSAAVYVSISQKLADGIAVNLL